jgi:hypothetical protein
MIAADDLHFEIEARNWATLCAGTNPWRAGAAMLADGLGLGLPDALTGAVVLKGVFARVSGGSDARRFEVAEGAARATASPALLLPVELDGQSGPDLVAWTITGPRRVWRWSLAATWVGELRPDHLGVIRIWQDRHAWLRRLLRAAAAAERAKARARAAGRLAGLEPVSGEDRMADGALVLAPAEIAWTRAGVLADADLVEIMDAPVDGPLGRALLKLNPRLGTARGVAIRGVEPVRMSRGAA